MKKIITSKTHIVLLTVVVINFICDILLFYNFSGANIDLSLIQLKETPLFLIRIGTLVGVIALSILILPTYEWFKKKTLSLWISLSYLIYILGCILFHGLFYFLGEALHDNNEILLNNLQSFIDGLGLFIFLTGVILTIALATNRYKKRISFPWLTLLLFPVFTMIFFGIILNKVIFIPEPYGGYYAVLSGTIPIFLLILSLNQISTMEKKI